MLGKSNSNFQLALPEINVKALLMAYATATLLLNPTGYAVAQDKPATQAPQAAAQPAKPDPGQVPLGQRGNPQDQRRQMDHPGSHEVESASSKEPGAGAAHDLYKGNKLPVEYHHRPQYVVDDWRSHHLSAPPRGHHWVQVGYVYALVAISTGTIVKLVTVK